MDDQYNTSAGALVPETVPSYLVPAILVTIFCCNYLGIPALIFAAQSDGLLKAGDPIAAGEAAKKAKMWCWISFGIGLTGILLYVAVYGFIIFGAMSAGAGAAGGGFGGF